MPELWCACQFRISGLSVLRYGILFTHRTKSFKKSKDVSSSDVQEIENMKASSGMNKVRIWVRPSAFAPEFEMIIRVPNDRDTEEYIEELLDGILREEFRYNVEWGFDEYEC